MYLVKDKCTFGITYEFIFYHPLGVHANCAMDEGDWVKRCSTLSYSVLKALENFYSMA